MVESEGPDKGVVLLDVLPEWSGVVVSVGAFGCRGLVGGGVESDEVRRVLLKRPQGGRNLC
jgi:hypothetical protein